MRDRLGCGGMDGLTGLLDGPRARNAFLLRVIMSPPWSVRVQDEAPISIVAVTDGDVWVVFDDADPVALRPGDVAIMRGPDPYTVADHPDTPPQVICLPGERCVTPDGQPMSEAMGLGTRMWGNDADGDTTMLVGTYPITHAIGRGLLLALPPLIILRRGDWESPLVPLLGTEIVKDEPGQDLVLDRLLDLLLVSALRAWLSRPGADTPQWYRAYDDPIVGPALRHLHNAPGQPWTVASLAAAIGVSRATLARRFNELVGQPPMTFLTEWRLALAADLLREPEATLGAVARQVGYASPYALSAAFKRVHGASPRHHRALARAREPALA
jgi:AraC-like DNA-binding protein